MSTHDVLLTGGRVIDPATGFDAVADLAITGGEITYLAAPGKETPEAETVVDATGKILAPGFIDLHAHGQNLTGHRLQAFDGVTTTLELESGAAPIRSALNWSAEQGRPLHYGFSAGWLHSRILVMEELEDKADALDPLPLDSWASLQHLQSWRGEATPEQIGRIVELTAKQLDAGGLGIGMLLGYAPGTSAAELQAIAELAVQRDVPLFVHARRGGPEGLEELLELSRRTGVQVHLCHFGSTNSGSLAESTQLVLDAYAEGLPFTTESYPFGMSSTVIGAAFLDPEVMKQTGRDPRRIIVLETGEEIASYERLAELRAEDPGTLILGRTYDERIPEDRAALQQAVTLKDAAFASDSMPVKPASSGCMAGLENPTDIDEWPLPEGFVVHPRATGCFTRAISWLARDAQALSLSEVIARSSTIPARIMSRAFPEFKRKGTLQPGSDADLVVFDLESLTPNEDFTRVEPTTGVDQLWVGGVQVIEDGQLKPEAKPGRALLG